MSGGTLFTDTRKRFLPVYGEGKAKIMKQRQIRLKLEEVKEFVTVASRCDFDVDVFYNRFTVDAKSIVGVLALDLNRMLTVSYNGYNPEFENMIDRLAMAG